MNKVIDLPVICTDCGKEVQEGDIYMTHPKYGTVCENCPAFKDGGLSPTKEDGMKLNQWSKSGMIIKRLLIQFKINTVGKVVQAGRVMPSTNTIPLWLILLIQAEGGVGE